MIVLVLGPDAALAREQTAAVVAARDPGGDNTSWLDAAETPLPRIITAVGSAGFFGTGRVVVVRDLLVKAGKGKSGAPVDSDDAPVGSLDLAPLFATVPPENTLVLVDPALSSVPAGVKKVLPKDAVVHLGEPPRGGDLVAWIERAAREAGAGIEREAARLLAATLFPQTWQAKPSNPRFDRPPDLDLLRSRVAVLALYAYPEPVSPAHVRALSEGAPDDRIFRFVEAAANGDIGVAARELEQLLRAGEEPAKLVAQVFGQIELGAVAAAGAGTDPAELGRRLGLANPNQLVAIARSQRGGAGQRVRIALETDRAFKTGRLRQPTDALLALMTGFAADAREPGRDGRAPHRGLI
jgi:DNA polymerase III delta subunit